jgi:hypothetical protein
MKKNTLTKFVVTYESKRTANRTSIVKASGPISIDRFVPISKLKRMYKDIHEVIYLELKTDGEEIPTHVYTSKVNDCPSKSKGGK